MSVNLLKQRFLRVHPLSTVISNPEHHHLPSQPNVTLAKPPINHASSANHMPLREPRGKLQQYTDTFRYLPITNYLPILLRVTSKDLNYDLYH